MDESTIYRLIKKIENILIKSGKFNLPGKKELRKFDAENNLVVLDVMESSLEKPKQNQKSFFSGKKKEHTLKTQIIIEQKTKRILCLAHGKGKIHDFKLLKSSGVKFNQNRKLLADKGYQGIKKIHGLSETPQKKPRGGKLSKNQKKSNRELNRIRVVIEHVNRRLKIFKILSYRYRNRHKRFGLRINLIAGIYNYELA